MSLILVNQSSRLLPDASPVLAKAPAGIADGIVNVISTVAKKISQFFYDAVTGFVNFVCDAVRYCFKVIKQFKDAVTNTVTYVFNGTGHYECTEGGGTSVVVGNGIIREHLGPENEVSSDNDDASVETTDLEHDEDNEVSRPGVFVEPDDLERGPDSGSSSTDDLLLDVPSGSDDSMLEETFLVASEPVANGPASERDHAELCGIVVEPSSDTMPSEESDNMPPEPAAPARRPSRLNRIKKTVKSMFRRKRNRKN